MRSLNGHRSIVYAIESLSDGTIISGSTDKLAIIWDAKSGVKLNSFTPLSYITAIREISPQVIAIGFNTVNTVVFYRVNGSMTPVLIQSMDLPSQVTTIYSMVVASISDGSLMLYAGYNSGSVVFNVTDVNSITLSQIQTDVSFNLAMEKSGII